MDMIRRAIILIIVLILLVSCQPSQQAEQVVAPEQPFCTPPYIEYKRGDCCLDANSNNICDRDEIKDSQKQVEIIEEKDVPDKTEELEPEKVSKEEDEQILGRILKLQEKRVKEYNYFFDIGWDETHEVYHSNTLNITLFFYFERPIIISGQDLHIIRINHTKQEYLGGWINPIKINEIVWYNLTEKEVERFKTANDVVLLYEDVPIEKIVSGGMYLYREVYEVHLENGVIITFDEYHNFPLKVKGTEYSSYDFVLTEAIFNTVPKSKYQDYRPG